MATHDRYEQDVLNALKGINSSLKRIADILKPKPEKKTYKMRCVKCNVSFTFEDQHVHRDIYYKEPYIVCQYCGHPMPLPETMEDYVPNEQNN